MMPAAVRGPMECKSAVRASCHARRRASGDTPAGADDRDAMSVEQPAISGAMHHREPHGQASATHTRATPPR